jgi:hypothetical protein
MIVHLKEIIKSDTALTPDSGSLVFEVLSSALSKDESISIDFSGIEVMTSAFLNAAIGQLYSQFNSEKLNKFLKVKNLPIEDRALLLKVIERAKDYFKDQNAFNNKMGERYDHE